MSTQKNECTDLGLSYDMSITVTDGDDKGIFGFLCPFCGANFKYNRKAMAELGKLKKGHPVVNPCLGKYIKQTHET